MMNPEFRAKFGSHLGRLGEQPVMDFWHQGRKWMDDALINANVLGGGTPWLAASADELWVMRLPLGGRKPYSPEAFR